MAMKVFQESGMGVGGGWRVGGLRERVRKDTSMLCQGHQKTNDSRGV